MQLQKFTFKCRILNFSILTFKHLTLKQIDLVYRRSSAYRDVSNMGYGSVYIEFTLNCWIESFIYVICNDRWLDVYLEQR